MHELYILKDVAEQLLVPAGFSLQEENLHPDDFGSYFAIYTRSGEVIRFVWDGKDGWGFLEHRQPQKMEWRHLGEPIPEAHVDNMRESAFQEWQRALESIL